MNCILGVDDRVVESICNGLFQRNREFYAKDELNEASYIIYREPPPLHEVWLDEAGRRQGNEDRIRLRRQNEDLMRDRNCAVWKSISPPVVTDVDDANVPGVAPISDNGSVDSSLFSRASESEGDIWGNNNYDDDASNAHEGANLVPPDFDGNEGVQLTPNITPAPPEGTHRRTCGKAKEYPPAVWRRGADGNNMFALTFGQQDIPPIVSRDLVIWP